MKREYAGLLFGLAERLAQFLAHHVAERGRRTRRAPLAAAVALCLGDFRLACRGLHRQADFALGRIHRDDLGLDRLTRLDHLARIAHALFRHLGDVHETLDALLELDERP